MSRRKTAQSVGPFGLAPAQQTVRQQIGKVYRSWPEVMIRLRQACQHDEAQCLALVSFDDIQQRKRPVYLPLSNDLVGEYETRFIATLTSAREFRVWIDEAPFPKSESDQSPPLCATVLWLKRGDDIDAYLERFEL